MGLNIKDEETCLLARDLARLTGETMTGAITVAPGVAPLRQGQSPGGAGLRGLLRLRARQGDGRAAAVQGRGFRPHRYRGGVTGRRRPRRADPHCKSASIGVDQEKNTLSMITTAWNSVMPSSDRITSAPNAAGVLKNAVAAMIW